MTSITYVVRRGLQAGATVGDQTGMDLRVGALDRHTNTRGKESVGAEGHSQMQVERRDVTWSLRSLELLDGSDEYDDWYEWLESVDEREVFDFDAAGTIASPDTVESAKLTNNYRRRRIQTSNYFIFSCTLRVVPTPV